MPVPPIQIELWDKTFTRLGYVGAPLTFTATKRRNAASDCTFSVPATHPRVANLITSGCRAVVTYRYEPDADPIRLVSGRVQNKSGDGPAGQATRSFSIRDDWNILASTLGFLDPTLAADDTNQSANGPYKISGPAETAALDVIDKNYATRLAPGRLVMPTSQGRGASVSLQFQMDYLADILFPAVDNAGIIVEIGQVDDHLELSVREPATYTRALTEGSGVVVGGTFSLDDVTATRVIVGVGGNSSDIPARVFRQFINTAAEAQIGEPLEVYVDGGSIALTDDITAQAQQMSDDAFTSNAEKVNLDLTLIESGAFKYGKTFLDGDNVTVKLNNTPQAFTDYVRDVQIDWNPGDSGQGGLIVSPHVGNWQDDPDSILFREVQSVGKALRSLQRR